MAARTETRTGVKAEDVAFEVAVFKAQTPPPDSVVPTLDGAGTYTIIATWNS